MNRPGSVGLVVLLVLSSVLAVGTTASLAAGGPGDAVSTTPVEPQTGAAIAPQDSRGLLRQETREFDNTTFEIRVHENGSATWTFRYEQRFTDDENATRTRENFEAFAEEFRANETGLYDRFTNQSRELTRAGMQESGREMEATNFRRSVRVEDQFTPTGVVEMSFTWTNFADVQDDRIVVGDVFDGVPLSADQAIVIEAAGDLTFRSIEPDDAQYAGGSLTDAESVRWSGKREFIDGRPRVVFDRPDSAAIGDGNAGLLGGNLVPILVGVLLLVVGVVAAVWYRRYGPISGGKSASDDDEPTPPAGGAAAGAGSTADPATDAADDSESIPNEELLTDEDRVVKLIRENGGRMKQVNIVEDTGWSKSKVSMLLSDMEEEGTISKLRVGRENIISLEGFEPEATKSPFEE
ncbi:helix-turn-helix transcriptional regulator [Natrinema sp. CGMCC1.2065]|uniref:helix-turn-helix transcriptional regulator n=1 Tax=Natrinema sp. CGMCC1.2065 TaxID=3445767 RepID=UPI003F49DF35